MIKTLYAKLSLVLAVLLIGIGLAYVLISQSLTQHYMLEADQTFNRNLARNLVADRNLVSQGRIDQQALEETFHKYMVINPSIEIYLLDREGTILAYSADPGVVKRKRVSLQPIMDFLAGAALPVLGDDPRSHDVRKSFSVTAVPSTANPEGYLYVVLRGEMYDSLERLYRDSLLLRLSAWTLMGSLGFGLLAGLLIFAVLTRRLRRLAQRMDGFRRSRFQSYTAYGGRGAGGDEVDQLGGTFDQMADRMQQMLQALESRDALRRELLNNVSHDLRTPLSCLHGYLETIRLKGEQMSEADRRDYLDAALRHSESLGRLVGELFELSKLEASAVQPQLEAFSVAELVQDIVLKFQPAAQEKQIRLRAQTAQDIPAVMADIGLIERVLENLIANAIRHTPEQGLIVIRLDREGDGVGLSVQDNGCGIAPDDLPYVFDRFYQGSKADDASHAGLGLAIAKGIVNLHHSDLQVASEPNQGTCFSFRLPVGC